MSGGGGDECSGERLEWVEIIEPRTRDVMYANLKTGECVWDPPEDVEIKRSNDNQWWELFDMYDTHRFYYYNVASQTTVWHRPLNCDIIPLAKLQTLKQFSTDIGPEDRHSSSNHNSKSSMPRIKLEVHNNGGACLDSAAAASTGAANRERTAAMCSSSSSSTTNNNNNHHHNNTSNNNTNDKRYCRHKQPPPPLPHEESHHLVGMDSDSSLFGLHLHRPHQSGHHQVPRHTKNNYPPSLPFSTSSELAPAGVPGGAIFGTPQPKKKVTTANTKAAYQPTTAGGSQSVAPEFASVGKVSLTRSGSFVTSSPRTQCPRKSQNAGSALREYLGINSDDDSMHEKYFKSVESTPRRRHTTGQQAPPPGGGSTAITTAPVPSNSTKKSNDSTSPRSPISPLSKSRRPQHYGTMDSSPKRLSDSDDLLNLDLTGKPERYLDKMRLVDKGKISPGSAVSNSSGLSLHHHQASAKYKALAASAENQPFVVNSSSSANILPVSSQCGATAEHQHAASRAAYSSSSLNKERSGERGTAVGYSLNKPNLERHNKGLTKRSDSRAGSGGVPLQARVAKDRLNPLQKQTLLFGNEEIDYESPLYSNWDQEHLLPLQHYIIEQAKLSGCYRTKTAEGTDDSDSLCDSQSEHSFSGHEPDNEDSDNSEDRGDYLAHQYGAFGEDLLGGRQNYYNMGDFEGRMEREDISSEVEAKLESARSEDKLYSPVNSTGRGYFQHSATTMSVPVHPPPGQDPKREGSRSAGQMMLTNQHQLPPSAGPVAVGPQPPIHQHHAATLSKATLNAGSSAAVPTSGPATLRHFFSREEYPNQPIYGTQFGPVAPLAIMKETDIEKFAQDNLNLHSKGIFRKKSSVRDMLSFTSDAISRPMLAVSRDKTGKKMAIEMFKLVQIYMGDRKARQGMSLNSVAIDIISMAVLQPPLRDELYVQLCRQTTENPKRESMIRGWELMAICLSFLPPSPTFQPALLNYMKRHHDPSFATSFPEFGKWPIHVQVSHYATIACRRLERIGSSGKKKAKKPTEDEVNQARDQIFRDSMYGNTLDEVMHLQKERFPDRQLPWIQVTLSEQVLFMGGKETEGIFRVPADVDEVTYLKYRLDQWETPNIPSMDAHAPASLLKLWYRELYDPLIPDGLYDECVQTDDPVEVAAIIEKLPAINRLVLTYLIHFLQQFAQPDVVVNTKMDSSNLAMVFAPNCLRCTSQDPKVILENARKEMAFLRTLITNMDTKQVAYLQ